MFAVRLMRWKSGLMFRKQRGLFCSFIADGRRDVCPTADNAASAFVEHLPNMDTGAGP